MLRDPATQQVGIQTMVQSNGCDRDARMLAGRDDLGLECGIKDATASPTRLRFIDNVHVSAIR
jgi:hypothetical protein